ncbi:MAG: FHA domain-containing protein [Kofleriaceae bacterium]
MDTNTSIMAANAKKLGLTPEDRTYLLVLSGPLAGKIIALTTSIVLGRGADADLQISDEDALSRKHCRLFIKDGSAYVEDLHSRNGTFVNGARVELETLRDGDKVGLGGTTILKFTHDDSLETALQPRS